MEELMEEAILISEKRAVNGWEWSEYGVSYSTIATIITSFQQQLSSKYNRLL